jgi:hypothetical protein
MTFNSTGIEEPKFKEQTGRTDSITVVVLNVKIMGPGGTERAGQDPGGAGPARPGPEDRRGHAAQWSSPQHRHCSRR